MSPPSPHFVASYTIEPIPFGDTDVKRAWRYLKKYEDPTRVLRKLETMAYNAKLPLDVARAAAVGGPKTTRRKIRQMKEDVQREKEKYERIARTYMAALHVVSRQR